MSKKRPSKTPRPFPTHIVLAKADVPEAGDPDKKVMFQLEGKEIPVVIVEKQKDVLPECKRLEKMGFNPDRKEL